MQLAPMIDIVFLLLIFFIVTWQFTKSETELSVSVPTAQEGADPQRRAGLPARTCDTATVRCGTVFLTGQDGPG